jgi:hypothetical protein
MRICRHCRQGHAETDNTHAVCIQRALTKSLLKGKLRAGMEVPLARREQPSDIRRSAELSIRSGLSGLRKADILVDLRTNDVCKVRHLRKLRGRGLGILKPSR